MAESFGGSVAFFVGCLVVISGGVLLLLRHYLPLRSTPAFLLLPVFLALALPCSIILLVPIDLASNAVEQDGEGRGVRLPDGSMLVIWRIAYWLTFILTWALLPVLGEYVDSGYRDPKDRLVYSLRSNIRYQLIVLGCGVAGLVYYMLANGFKGTSLKGLVIALAYAWGLTLAIYLMGHGLVALPRRLWRHASVTGRLKHLQAAAPGIHDKMTQAILELEELEAQVWTLRRTKNHGRLQGWVDELAESSDIPEPRGSHEQTATAGVPAVVTERYLADLTRKLKRARHKRIRFIEEWDYLGVDPGVVAAENAPFDARLRYYLHAYVLVAARYALAGLLAILSICLVWSEVINPLFPRASILRYTIVHHPHAVTTGKIGLAGQLISGVWLCYMCAAALFSIRQVPIWGNRALVRRHTYAESATWYACQVAKLTVPLSFNFIMLLPREIYAESTFYNFLGVLIDLTALSSVFNHYFQISILVPVIAALFNLYARVQGVFGFGVFDDDIDAAGASGFGGWREGRALLERDRLDRRNPSAVGLSSQPSHAIPPRQAPFPPAPSREPAQEQAQEEETGFAAFTHRLRNTFETSSRPKWLGGAGLAGGETSGRADFGGTLGKWFGGRPDDGRVRL